MHLSKDLLRYGTKNGLYFSLEYPSPDFRIDQEDHRQLVQVAPKPYISLMVATSNSASKVDSLSLYQFRKFEVYWQLLAELASDSDMERLRWLFLREGFYYDRVSIILTVTAESGASIAVTAQDQKIKDIDLQSLKNPHIILKNTISSPQILVTWLNETNQTIFAKVAGFKGKGYRFSLETVNEAK